MKSTSLHTSPQWRLWYLVAMATAVEVLMTMGAMKERSSRSLEKLLAQQRRKEIAADDYSCRIETWLRLADQMLTSQDEQKQNRAHVGNSDKQRT